MSFFALSKSPRTMLTLRQRVRFACLYWRKVRKVHRKLNQTELLEMLAEVLNETKILFSVVGALTVAWAQVEVFLDYINAILIMREIVTDKRFPKSLRLKIAFFKKWFTSVPELVSLCDRVTHVVSELNRLKKIRHDIVHGVAIERTIPGYRKVARFEYVGNSLEMKHETYEFVAIVNAAKEMDALRNELIALFRDMMFILHPDQAKEHLSELQIGLLAVPIPVGQKTL